MEASHGPQSASEDSLELSVIVPTYNERDNIVTLLERVESSLKGRRFELIVVDDNSPDGTADVAYKASERYGNVKVIRRPAKLGLGSAVTEGARVAKANVLAVMDADLQHPPELLPKMLDKINEGFDIVVASRYIRGGGIEGWGLWRRLVSRVAIALAKLALPRVRGFKDSMSGFFMFKRGVIDGVELKPKGFKVLLEILVKGKWNAATELPYMFKPRLKGKSKLNTKEVYSYIKYLLELSSYRPIKFAAVGASGIVVNEGLLHLLIHFIPLQVAGALAIETSVLSNFILNNYWTFKDRKEGGILSKCLRYHGAVAIGALVNYVVLLSLVAFLGMHYLIANLIGIFLGFLANYSVSELFVWRS